MIRMIEWAFSHEAPDFVFYIAFASALVNFVVALAFSAACLVAGYWLPLVLIWIVAPIAIIAAAYKRRDK